MKGVGLNLSRVWFELLHAKDELTCQEHKWRKPFFIFYIPYFTKWNLFASILIFGIALEKFTKLLFWRGIVLGSHVVLWGSCIYFVVVAKICFYVFIQFRRLLLFLGVDTFSKCRYVICWCKSYGFICTTFGLYFREPLFS